MARDNQIDFPLPKEVAAIGPSMRTGENFQINPHLENFFLAFYRLVPMETKDDKQHKVNYLRALEGHWEILKDKAPGKVLQAVCERRAAQQKALKSEGYESASFEWYTEWRLIAGLGYKGALEVGITLHPLYGFPYLPGSSIKGVARAWAERVLLPDGKTTKDEIHTVFGSEPKGVSDAKDNRLGAVTFLDALPADFPKLEVDIINVHHKEYYENKGESPPGDWEDPNPVYFLAVAPDVPFTFRLHARDAQALNDAEQWLKMGLQELGAGGKTSAGYGFFSEQTAKERSKKLMDAVRQAEKERRVAALPDKFEHVGKYTTDLPAQIVGKEGPLLKVRLHAEGYEDQTFNLGGINAEGFNEGDWVLVNVAGYSGKKKRVTQISYAGRLS
jgi:CRISPR-associated protein Cmr6